MAKRSKVAGAIVEELIGIATTLIPEPKVESPSFSAIPELEIDATMDNIRSMKSLLQTLKENEVFTSCPDCMTHLARIEEELNWAEKRVPSYTKVVQLKRQLGALYELVKPSETAPKIAEEGESKLEAEPKLKHEFKTTPPKGESLDYCLECSIKHSQTAKVLAREGLQRAEAGSPEDEGVKEKIRDVNEELAGLENDTDTNLDVAEVRAINAEARDIRREIWDKKLALGQGAIDDFKHVYGRLDSLVKKVYSTTEKVGSAKT